MNLITYLLSLFLLISQPLWSMEGGERPGSAPSGNGAFHASSTQSEVTSDSKESESSPDSRDFSSLLPEQDEREIYPLSVQPPAARRSLPKQILRRCTVPLVAAALAGGFYTYHHHAQKGPLVLQSQDFAQLMKYHHEQIAKSAPIWDHVIMPTYWDEPTQSFSADLDEDLSVLSAQIREDLGDTYAEGVWRIMFETHDRQRLVTKAKQLGVPEEVIENFHLLRSFLHSPSMKNMQAIDRLLAEALRIHLLQLKEISHPFSFSKLTLEQFIYDQIIELGQQGSGASLEF